MEIHIESTDVITTVDGVPCRVWNGLANGLAVKVFVHRIVAREEDDRAVLESELKAMPEPRELPLRTVLDPRLF